MTHHGYKRERQMPALNEFARGRAKNDFPAILVGDFNTDPESAEIRYLKGLQSLQGGSAYWCDAWDHAGDGSKGATWSKSNDFAAWAPWPDRRIDYIFVAQPSLDGAGTIEYCSVVCNDRVDEVWPSGSLWSVCSSESKVMAFLHHIQVRIPVKGEKTATEAMSAMRVILRNIQRSDLNLLAAYRKIPILNAPPAPVT